MPSSRTGADGRAPSPDDLPNIGRPATSALEVVGITTLTQVSRHTERELLALHGVGPKAIRILRAALAEAGLSFTE